MMFSRCAHDLCTPAWWMLDLLCSYFGVQQVDCPALRGILPVASHSQIYSVDQEHLSAVQAKTEIAAEVREALQKSMESFGFIIVETLVGCPPADCSRSH